MTINVVISFKEQFSWLRCIYIFFLAFKLRTIFWHTPQGWLRVRFNLTMKSHIVYYVLTPFLKTEWHITKTKTYKLDIYFSIELNYILMTLMLIFIKYRYFDIFDLSSHCAIHFFFNRSAKYSFHFTPTPTKISHSNHIQKIGLRGNNAKLISCCFDWAKI